MTKEPGPRHCSSEIPYPLFLFATVQFEKRLMPLLQDTYNKAPDVQAKRVHSIILVTQSSKRCPFLSGQYMLGSEINENEIA